MVDRLFWRAGFGPTQAQRARVDGQAAVGARRLVPQHADRRSDDATPPAADLDHAAAPIDPLASDDRARARVDRPHAARGQPAARTGSRSSGTATGRSAATTAIPLVWVVNYRDRLLKYADFAHHPALTFRQLAYEMTTRGRGDVACT